MKTHRLLIAALILLAAAQSAMASGCQASFRLNTNYAYVNQSIEFYSTSSASVSKSRLKYSWNFGDGPDTNHQHKVQHTYTSPGVYLVCLSIYDSLNNCSSSYCDSLFVSATNDSIRCKAQFSYAAKPGSRSVTFHNKSIYSDSTTTFTWNFGDSYSQQTNKEYLGHIYYPSGGNSYTVTLYLKSASCSDSTTMQVIIPEDSCHLNLSYRFTDSCSIQCTVQTDSALQSSVYINFGDGYVLNGSNQYHTYSSRGNYVLRAFVGDSSSGCTAEAIDSIYVAGCDSSSSTCNYTLTGSVYHGGRFADFATVYLIKKDSNLLYAIDSAKVDSGGVYVFRGLCKGVYLLKAALDSIDTAYVHYLPTYYENALTWNRAGNLHIQGNAYNYNINLVRGTNTGGPGFISGNVLQGANKKEGDPLGQVQIILLNSQHKPVAYTYSKANGQFSFSNLALQQYFLLVEIPGIEAKEEAIVLSKENPSIKTIEIKVNSKDVSTSISYPSSFKAVHLTLYPNPTSQFLKVEAPVSNAWLSITTLDGKVLQKQKFNGIMQFDVTGLLPGAYLIELGFSANEHLVAGRQLFIKN